MSWDLAFRAVPADIRVLKLGPRYGDASEMVILELLDRPVDTEEAP